MIPLRREFAFDVDDEVIVIPNIFTLSITEQIVLRYKHLEDMKKMQELIKKNKLLQW